MRQLPGQRQKLADQHAADEQRRGKPNSRPIFFVTLVAMWTVAPVAARVINRLRFKRWRRRGLTEVWVRSPEPLPGGLADS